MAVFLQSKIRIVAPPCTEPNCFRVHGNESSNMCKEDEDGIIELHNLRLSPIPSLRNRAKPIMKTKIGNPSLRFIRSSEDKRFGECCSRTPVRRSQRRQKNVSRSLRQSMTFPKIKDVNIIDKYSRFFFPAAFALFNFVYWGSYNYL